MDSNTILDEEIEQVAADFLDGEIVDLASDWLGNTVCFLESHPTNVAVKIWYRLFKSSSKSALFPRAWLCSTVSVLI